LHNFLSIENSAFLNGISNVENNNCGASRYNNQLQSLDVINVRPNQNSLHVRSTFKEYFNTVGSVPWQENML